MTFGLRSLKGIAMDTWGMLNFWLSLTPGGGGGKSVNAKERKKKKC